MIDLTTGRQQGKALAPPQGSPLHTGVLVLFPRQSLPGRRITQVIAG
jgi:hypothetical protein